MGKCVSKAVENTDAVFPRHPSKDHGDLIGSVAMVIADGQKSHPNHSSVIVHPEKPLVEGRATPPEIVRSNTTSTADLASGVQPPSSSALMINTTARLPCKFVTIPTQQPAEQDEPDSSGSPTSSPQRHVNPLLVGFSPSNESIASSAHTSDSIIAHRQLSPTVSGTIIPLRVIAQLGSGLDARVYSARRVDTLDAIRSDGLMLDTYLTPSEEVAVKVTRLVPKVVRTEPKNANGKYAGQNYAYTGTLDSSSRAFDEFRILKNLSGHPNIIKVFNTFESDKHVYQVSEKCLGDLVDVARAVCVSEALLSQWAFQMISALSYAHERDVVHGDIKPDNILMRKDGTIAVSDWGFARDSSNQRSPHCKEFHGTDHYSPPEWLLQERGKSKEADVWGVGAVIFSVAYGKLPFGKVSRDNPESVKRVCVEPLSFYAEVRTASVALKLFISSMMAKKWRDRQQMKEFLRHPWLARETEIRTDINNIISVLSRPAAPDTAEQEGDQ